LVCKDRKIWVLVGQKRCRRIGQNGAVKRKKGEQEAGRKTEGLMAGFRDWEEAPLGQTYFRGYRKKYKRREIKKGSSDKCSLTQNGLRVTS